MWGQGKAVLSMALGTLAGSDSKRQTGLGGRLVGRVWGAKRSHFESEPGREAEYQQNRMREVLESFWLPGLGSVKQPDFRVANGQTEPSTGVLASVPADLHTVPSVIYFCTWRTSTSEPAAERTGHQLSRALWPKVTQEAGATSRLYLQ